MTDALETDKQGNSLLRRLVLYLRWPAAIFALAGLALSSWVHIESLRGIDVESTRPSVWLLHYLLFPIILVVVLEASAVVAQKRLDLRGFLALVPGWALVLLAASLVYALATFLVFTPYSGAGDPLIQDGRFFFNPRSDRRPVPLPAQRLLAPLFQRLAVPLSCRGRLFARRKTAARRPRAWSYFTRRAVRQA